VTRAVVLEAPRDLRVVTRPDAAPAHGEVVVEVAACGICGSDVDLLEGTRPDGYVRYPLVPGHEWAGVVVDAAPDVDRALLHRLVVAENIRRCGRCAPCAHGDAPRCETRYDETGFTRDGAWAEHLVVPAAYLHVLPADADLRAAAVIEPAACAADAVARAAPEPGARLAVVGGGTIGLLATQLLRAREPAELVIVEPRTERHDMAARAGASRTVAYADELDATFDVVVEAAGARGTAATAIELARRGGRVVLAGIPAVGDVVATQALVTRAVEVRTVFGASSRAWRDAVTAFASGVLDPAMLVTHELPLTEVGAALALVNGRDPAVGKVLLRP
jgi:2-desacetyl-2-hydroxyethyl bacteriochlorophyllide A dehydrogenase